MFEKRLQRELEEVARRIRRNRLWLSLSILWTMVALIGVIGWMNVGETAEAAQRLGMILVALAALAGGVTVFLVRESTRDVRGVAQIIEQLYPDLDSRQGLPRATNQPASGP